MNEKRVKHNLEEWATENYSVWLLLGLFYGIIVVMAAIYYNIIPTLLNYDVDAFAALEKSGGPPYIVQYIVIFSLYALFGTAIIVPMQNGIASWKLYANPKTAEDEAKLQAIRKKCASLPYQLYIVFVLLFTFIVLVVFGFITFSQGTSWVSVPKTVTVVFAFLTLVGTLYQIVVSRVYNRILMKTFIRNEPAGKRRKLSQKIFLQIIPLFIVSVLFTSLMGYSRVVSETGNLKFVIYHDRLVKAFASLDGKLVEADISSKLTEIETDARDTVSLFYAGEDHSVQLVSGEPFDSIAFQMYLQHFFDKKNGHLMTEIGERQIAAIKVTDANGAIWTVGIKYELFYDDLMLYFIGSLFFMLLLSMIILYMFSRNLSKEISRVADGLKDISEHAYMDFNTKLAVTTNDELADLIVAFNVIQEREKLQIEEMTRQQTAMMEQERMAGLGQLMSGIAHNMRTPLMSLSGGIEGLRDLVKEYEESFSDETVTQADHQEIAAEMKNWLNKMRPYTAYMADIIAVIREQTLQPSQLDVLPFSAEDLKKRVMILMDHEIRSRHFHLEIINDVDESIRVKGPMSTLIQALNNLILNAADAYEEPHGKILVHMTYEDQQLIISVTDNGRGMDDDTRNKLFKQMVTTKGTKGTGLGLFMSVTNIRGRFGGNIEFKSELGKGSTFCILIPIVK